MDDSSFGTTILALKYPKGIIMAADTQTVKLVGNDRHMMLWKDEEKMFKINTRILGALAGYYDVGQKVLKYLKLKYEGSANICPKEVADEAYQEMLKIYQEAENDFERKRLEGEKKTEHKKEGQKIVFEGIKLTLLIGGWDPKMSTWEIYRVDYETMVTSADTYLAGGSGSRYALKAIEDRMRKKKELSPTKLAKIDEYDYSLETARRAMYRAYRHDTGTGGFMQVYNIKDKGVAEVSYESFYELKLKLEELGKQYKTRTEKTEKCLARNCTCCGCNLAVGCTCSLC